MGTGFARILHKKTGKKVAFGKPDEFIYYSDEIFTGNPKIATPDEVNAGLEVTWCPDTPSSRWYILRKLPDGWLWNWETGLRPIPGEIWLTKAEVSHGKRAGEDFLLIEPHSKDHTTRNRDWGFQRWQRVVELLPDVRKVQIGLPGVKVLDGVEFVPTTTFRDACSVAANAKAFAGVDGGLVHACAAVGVRSVVVWSGYVSHKLLGYESNINLQATDEICGKWLDCPHCWGALDKIDPETVAASCKSIMS